MARVLIVEDEMLVAMLIEDIVCDLGHQVAGLAMRLETAIEAAEGFELDVAILDINLAGKQSFPVAEVLMRRGIPFFFASGYGAAGLSEHFAQSPVVQKPFEVRQIDQMLKQALGG